MRSATQRCGVNLALRRNCRRAAHECKSEMMCHASLIPVCLQLLDSDLALGRSTGEMSFIPGNDLLESWFMNNALMYCVSLHRRRRLLEIEEARVQHGLARAQQLLARPRVVPPPGENVAGAGSGGDAAPTTPREALEQGLRAEIARLERELFYLREWSTYLGEVHACLVQALTVPPPNMAPGTPPGPPP